MNFVDTFLDKPDVDQSHDLLISSTRTLTVLKGYFSSVVVQLLLLKPSITEAEYDMGHDNVKAEVN